MPSRCRHWLATEPFEADNPVAASVFRIRSCCRNVAIRHTPDHKKLVELAAARSIWQVELQDCGLSLQALLRCILGNPLVNCLARMRHDDDWTCRTVDRRLLLRCRRIAQVVDILSAWLRSLCILQLGKACFRDFVSSCRHHHAIDKLIGGCRMACGDERLHLVITFSSRPADDTAIRLEVWGRRHGF